MQQIEENVVRWLCDLFGFPAESRGILTSGGSIANLSAVVTARHAKLGEDFWDGTYYVSDQAHASVSKAATIAGFAKRNLRVVPTDAELRMDVGALRDMIHADRAAGPAAVPRGSGRRHDEHGRDRSPRRRGGYRGRRGSVDARRWRLRRLLPAHGARSSNASAGSSAPTRSRSTRTRGCSCPTARAR